MYGSSGTALASARPSSLGRCSNGAGARGYFGGFGGRSRRFASHSLEPAADGGGDSHGAELEAKDLDARSIEEEAQPVYGTLAPSRACGDPEQLSQAEPDRVNPCPPLDAPRLPPCTVDGRS